MSSSKKEEVLLGDMIVKAPRRQPWDVGIWRQALASADRGRVAPLYDLYEDMLIDPVLSDACDKRVDAVLNGDLKFLDGQGREVEELAELIDSEPFELLLESIMEARLRGRSGVELTMGAYGMEVFQIPSKHISLESEKILLDVNETEGIPYAGVPNLMILGRPRDYGIVLPAIPFAIYKRGGFGDWSQWVELFGMPQRIGKYSTYDPASKKLLEQAMEEMGSAPYLVIPKEADVEMHDTNSGNGNAFNEFRQACNEEMLIALLGQTLTTIAGERGARSLGEVHQSVEGSKNRRDIRMVVRALNRHLIPWLALEGYPVKGGSFVSPQETELPSVQDLATLSTMISIPKYYIHERFGIPVEETGEEETKPSKSATEKEVKEHRDPFFQAPHHHVGRSLGEWWKRWKLSIGVGSVGRLTHLADGRSIDVRKLLEEALQEIYGNEGIQEGKRISPALFGACNQPIIEGISSTFEESGFGERNPLFVQQFRENSAVFSAFKAHAEQAALVETLLDREGNLKSFREWKKDALKICGKWNEQWLRTEYNTAVRAARSAVIYQDALATKQLYPNLEYLRSTSKDKREEHLAYVGTVLPIEHEWWDTHMPPSSWNCACSVRPTKKEATAVPLEAGSSAPLRQNPGKTASPFRLTDHPYVKSSLDPTCPECRKLLVLPRKLADLTPEEERRLCPMHRIASETEAQKKDAKVTSKRLLSELRTKQVRYPEFGNRAGKFVRNSVTENLRYGELYPIKKEILEHLEEYTLSPYKYKFEPNIKSSKESSVLGYHKFTVEYLGIHPLAKGRKVELQFEERKTGDIFFHFIKLI